MLFIYQIILSSIILISPIIVIVRIVRNKEDKLRFKEKFCFFSEKRTKGKLVWFHGASVGEIMSIIPLINKYEKDNKIKNILITSSTVSSSRILEKFKFKKVTHQFFPIDHIFFTNKFLEYWKPDIAIFLESEIWPMMFVSIKKHNIPLILLNARITKKSFNKWFKLKNFSKSIFSLIDYAYPQNIETSYFLKKLDLKKIKFIGNLKFIDYEKKKSDILEKNLSKKFKKYKICVAASTHEPEELFAAQTHKLLKQKYENIITIIIPRHIHRVHEIINELNRLNLRTTIHSSKNKNLRDTDIYIVDTFGESKKFYKIATSVFLGGSLINKGGQNPLEPTRYGAKILHGQFISNFKEIYKLLSKLKISKKISTPNQFEKSIEFKKNKKNLNKIKKLGTSILKKTLQELNGFILR
tara:strand:+ start:144 stop:1379 length:1236 start_codon:yes stop_codon:yes gene_type:complete